MKQAWGTLLVPRCSSAKDCGHSEADLGVTSSLHFRGFLAFFQLHNESIFSGARIVKAGSGSARRHRDGWKHLDKSRSPARAADSRTCSGIIKAGTHRDICRPPPPHSLSATGNRPGGIRCDIPLPLAQIALQCRKESPLEIQPRKRRSKQRLRPPRHLVAAIPVQHAAGRRSQNLHRTPAAQWM